MRFDPQGDFGTQLHSVFYGPGGSYERKMFLSRIGNTFFVILATLAVWAFAPVLFFVLLLTAALGAVSAVMIGLARALRAWRERR